MFSPTAPYLKLTVVLLLQSVQDNVEQLGVCASWHALKQPFVHGTCSVRVEVTDVNVTCEPRVLLANTTGWVSVNLVLDKEMNG